MSLTVKKEDRIHKKLFKLKPPLRDGLVLNVHRSDDNLQRVRFVNTCFNKEGNVAVLTDNKGNIFVIDFRTSKYWSIPKLISSCTAIKFSTYREYEVLAGVHSGRLYTIDTEGGHISGELIGHENPVSHITFANSFMCLTSSVCEAILWDLKTNTKVQVLNMEKNCTLKYTSFIPITNNILTCFNDDVIQIWQFGTFEVKSQIPPLVWYNHEVKNITFTQYEDGKVMVIGCRTPYIALFLLSNFKLLKFITLPEYIQTLKYVDFIPQITDGGSNKIMAILSGRGTIYFYDFDQNLIISELIASYEISRFDFSRKGNYLSCVLCSGDVSVYDIIQYIVVPIKVKAVRAPIPGNRVKKCLQKMGFIKEQIRDILDIEKLRMILKERGEYPDSYRMKIWESLLDLPGNKHQYNAIINSRMIVSFEDLCRKYPLENKRSLKNLKQLLDNLVTWCPFFLNVDYLPLFVFPFVKVFVNNPLICFEAVCTVIMNWCQFWFEYFPLPPVNILAMIENMLMEHDPELLDFLIKNNVSSELYAWPLLKTAFSEILTAPSWKILWDHVLTNEPSFLLCAVVACDLLLRGAILSLKDDRQFHCFFNTHHPIDVRKLLAKTYRILAETSEGIHPRQYLSMFQRIDAGEYPNFCNYPKTIVEMKTERSERMKAEMKNLERDEIDLYRRRFVRLDRMKDMEIQEEEKKRIIEMEKAIKRQLLDEQERLQIYYERVANLREKFGQDDEALHFLKSKIAKDLQTQSRRKCYASILDDVRFRRREKDQILTRIEDELLYHYSELLRHKYRIEKLLLADEIPFGTQISEPSVFEQQQEELSKEISQIKKRDKPQEYLKVANLATGLEAMDTLMDKIQSEIENQRRGIIDNCSADRRVRELKIETKELAAEIDNLVHLLIDLRHAGLDG